MAVYLRISLQRSCLLTVPSRPLFHHWISSESNSLGTFQSWFLVKLPVYHCSWNSSPLASVNCPASIIHYSFLYSFSGIALFMSQISNGKLAICVSNLVCWHVFIGPQSVLKMFTVAANKKKPQNHVESLNVWLWGHSGNDLAALGGCPPVAGPLRTDPLGHTCRLPLA